MHAGFPASLTFEWDEPLDVGEIQLVFDTGLHRHLTLSHHDGYTGKMVWGKAQPETVRDYTIEGLEGGRWQPLVKVNDNYLRLRRHTLDSNSSTTRYTAIRITVHATNGLDHARIMEVRVS